MKNLILFDMDGTLTESRKKGDIGMMVKLRELTKHANIGILTGSGFEYVKEQCGIFWNSSASPKPSSFTLLPCNGTQMYVYKNRKWEKSFSVSMRDYYGEDKFKELVQLLIKANYFYAKSNHTCHPLTGHFISYRESLVNWCPVGRNADEKDRQAFIKFDKNTQIRKKYLKTLNKFLKKNGFDQIEIVLGGDTSLDIYPPGWDKRFALQHFPATVNCWFVGDRCYPDGNDYHVYNELNQYGRAFKTSGPSETIKIINEIINKISS